MSAASKLSHYFACRFCVHFDAEPNSSLLMDEWYAEIGGKRPILPRGNRNNSGTRRRQLQSRADDLAERLLISELEMRRSRTLGKKLEGHREFGKAVDRIDALRRDVEEFAHWDAKDSIMDDLYRKGWQI